MSYDGQIPYLFGVPIPYVHGNSYEWRDNDPFYAELTFKGFHRGRSAANAVYVKDHDPEWKVTMFLSELSKLVEQGVAPKHLAGRFEFVKRGTNYGIVRVAIT